MLLTRGGSAGPCRTLTATKNRLKGANVGHKLLKKKSDALTVRIRMILNQVCRLVREKVWFSRGGVALAGRGWGSCQ